ncbi:hypothetical protein B0H19DRAFT_1067030 [Mycena capillaripes]|nr:hypothetical protein B0H19DRAFT_1067030 [Mycena capillaripes]
MDSTSATRLATGTDCLRNSAGQRGRPCTSASPYLKCTRRTRYRVVVLDLRAKGGYWAAGVRTNSGEHLYELRAMGGGGDSQIGDVRLRRRNVRDSQRRGRKVSGTGSSASQAELIAPDWRQRGGQNAARERVGRRPMVIYDNLGLGNVGRVSWGTPGPEMIWTRIELPSTPCKPNAIRALQSHSGLDNRR